MSESRLVITVDTRSAEQRVRDLGRAMSELERHGLGATVTTESMNRVISDTSRSANDAQAALSRMIKTAIAGFSAMKVIDIADEWGQYASRIKMATQSMDEYDRVQGRMLRSSQTTFRHVNETREAFIQLSPVLRQMGMSLDQSMDAIDAFSGLLVVNAASGDRATAAMRALSISFQKGKIDADQWMTIYSTLDSVVDVIATNTGKAADEVRRLGAEGKLTTDMLAQSLAGQYEAIMRQVEEMPTTVRDAMTNLSSAFGEYIGQANEANGVTATLADGIAFLGENVDTIMSVALAGGGVALAAYTARTVGATAATLADIVAKRASAAQELELATAQHAQATASLAQTRAAQGLTATRAQLVTQTAAQEAAERRLAAAQAGFTSASRGLLGLFGGPVGLIATLGLTVAGFVAIDGAAARSKVSMEILNGTVEDAVEKFSRLAESQRRAALAIAETNYASAVKDFDDALRELERGSLADGTRAVARWRAASTGALRDIAEAAKSGTISYEEADRQIVQLIDSYASANGMSKEWTAEQVRLTSHVMTFGQEAGKSKSMVDRLSEANDRLGASASDAANGVNGLNAALIKTDEAGKKYLEQLSDRALIAGLKTQREQLDALVQAGKMVFAPEDLERARAAADRIDAVNAASSRLTKGMSEAARAAKQLTEWLAEQGIATAGTEKMVQAYLDGGAAVSELARQQKIEEQVLKSGEGARKAVTDAINAQAKAHDRLDAARDIDGLRQQNAAGAAYLAVLAAQSVGVEEGRKALEDYNTEQALTALLVGKTREEIEDLLPLFREELANAAGIGRQTQALEELNRLVGSTRTRQEAYRAELARLVALRPYARTEEQVRALDRAIQELDHSNSVWINFTEKALERIDESFADMWRNVIDGSENAFDAMKSGFKQMLAEMAHAAITRPIMISVGNSIMGTSRPGGVGEVWGSQGGFGMPGGFSGGSLSGTVSQGIDFLGQRFGSSALQSFAGGMQGIGPGAVATVDLVNGTVTGGASSSASMGATFAQGLDFAGQILGYGKAVYDLSQGNYGSAVGTAIGTYILPGIGSAIGGMLGGFLDSSFKGETRFGAGYGIGHENTAIRSGGPSGGDPNEAGTRQALEQTWASMRGLAEMLGGSLDGYTMGAGYEHSPDKGRSFVWTDIVAPGEFVSHRDGIGRRDLSGVTDGNVVAQEFAVELQRSILYGLQMADLGGTWAEWFDRIDVSSLDSAGVQGVLDAVSALMQLRDVASAMGMQQLADASVTAQSNIIALAGGLDALGSSLQSYQQGFYSEQEQFDIAVASITNALSGLGLEMPALVGSADEMRATFRALVEMQDLSTEAGQRAYAGLLGLSGAFSSVANTADAAAQAAANLAAAQIKAIQVEYDAIAQAEYVVAQAAYTAAVSAADAAMRAVSRAIDARKAEIEAAFEAQASVIRETISASEAAVSRLESMSGRLNSTLDAMFGSLNPELAQSQAIRMIADAAAAARVTGTLPELSAIENALSLVTRPSMDAYSSLSDFQRDFYGTAADIGFLQEMTGKQLTVEQRMLSNAQDQLDRLQKQFDADVAYYDAMLDLAQSQYDAAMGNVVATMSVEAALSNLAAALATVRNTPMPTAPGSGQMTPEQIAAGWYDNILQFDDVGGVAYWAEQIRNLGRGAAFEAFEWVAKQQGSLPSFDVGTNYVPYDMTAKIHRGERIVPEADNRKIIAALSQPAAEQQSMSRLIDALAADNRRLYDMLYAALYQISKNTGRSATLLQLLDDWNQTGVPVASDAINQLTAIVQTWEDEGMPAERTA